MGKYVIVAKAGIFFTHLLVDATRTAMRRRGCMPSNLGLITPLESMPVWAQKFDMANPVAYLMRINRMVMLKGSTIRDISSDIYALIIIAVVFVTLAVRRYRKTA